MGGASVREGRLGRRPDGPPVPLLLQRGLQSRKEVPYDLGRGRLLACLGVHQHAFKA
jgi:hypothetical protein